MRAQVGEVVGARAGDDAIPNDSLVGGRHVAAVAAPAAPALIPLGRDVDKDLLGVPGEEARQVSLEVEPYRGVLLLLAAVVVRAALVDRDAGGAEGRGGGRPRREEVGNGYHGRDHKGHRREEAKGVLEPD